MKRLLFGLLMGLLVPAFALAATPVLRGVDNSARGNAFSPQNAATPAGTANNDVIVLGVWVGAAASTITCPSGYTQLGSTVSSSAHSFAMCWHKWLTGDTTTPSVSYTGGNISYAFTTVGYSGEDLTNPIDVNGTAQTGGSSTTLSLPSITTTVNNDMLVPFWATYQGSQSRTYTYTASLAQEVVNGTNFDNTVEADEVIASAGASGAVVATSTATLSEWAGMNIAIKASGAASPLGSTIAGPAKMAGPATAD